MCTERQGLYNGALDFMGLRDDSSRCRCDRQGIDSRVNSIMTPPSQKSASRALRSIPAGSFLRYNRATYEMELVGGDGVPLAVETQRSFFAQLPEVTLATLKASLLHCS
jgi:hypothetical protein